jgi:hypothetical protein
MAASAAFPAALSFAEYQQQDVRVWPVVCVTFGITGWPVYFLDQQSSILLSTPRNRLLSALLRLY